MAEGDITNEFGYDKIEIVNTWTLQIRKVTKIMEERSDGSKIELSRSFHRHVLQPFKSEKDGDTWTHTPTDLSGEDASVKAIAEAAWTDSVKAKYKTWCESQARP